MRGIRIPTWNFDFRSELKMEKNSKLDDNKKEILIIDDDEIILGVLSQLLSRSGYEVITADNGDMGLDLFLRKPYGIVLTDFDMPGMDGLTLAHHIKEKFPTTLVILMTGHDRESLSGRMKNGVVDFTLHKPFDLFTMLQILQEARTQH